MDKYFVLSAKATAKADKKMNNNTVKNLFKSFCLGDGELTLTEGADNTFVLGTTQVPALPAGKEWALQVDENGAAVVGRDAACLMRGFMVLLMKIEYTEDAMRIAYTQDVSAYRFENRAIHICIFPDSGRYFIQKLVRLCGLCQYSHIVIEFWGMLQYDCMKELSWPMAYTKEEAKALIQEARELGMEPVPMFNQLGHASACRVRHGKHVVLDQNPKLQHLFTGDGWDWNIYSEKVHALHKAIRKELYEVFGEGEYIHVGCDESYNYTHDEFSRKNQLPAFLNRLTTEVVEEGRRPMVWMDMMLERGKYPGATATCPADEVQNIQKSLHPKTVMVDWQYRIYEAPISTMMSLKDTGYDVMGAPWHNPANYTAFADTVAEQGFFGIMMTTWHTLELKMPSVLGCAKKCGATTHTWSHISSAKTYGKETAALWRRVAFEGNDFKSSGWTERDITELYVGQ